MQPSFSPTESPEAYETPTLVCFGSLAELTQGGSGTQAEGLGDNHRTKHP